ncbi:nitroreductase [Micromonospora sp. WMMD1102]|uniref:nitroreductase n=1 Tax=Micromonospora sp. WMMD1102 TaxID=3016105 RepID=UPI00241515B7|nr:nitroreductase [Micromonospora sp. WMMD1102]MDG4785355.1 nitroreductase [Micromonospora sp. WMMD1102]
MAAIRRGVADIAAFRALEPICWRAPSAHNTQPWRLDHRPEAIRVGWDPADALPAADRSGRDLWLSLGAFVETCLVVAADAGLRLEFVADHSARRRRVGWLRPAADRYHTVFDAAGVRGRRTHRGRFSAGPPAELVGTLDGIAREVDATVRRVPDADLLPRLLRLADRHLYADPAVVGELRHWLRLDPAHPDYRADGLTDRCLGLSRIEATGLRAALTAYPVLRRLGLPRLLATAAGNPLGLGGAVLVLVGPAVTDPTTRVGCGRALMRIWLALHAAGLAAHPLSQLVDEPTSRDALGAVLGVPAERLLHVARVGRPTGPVVWSDRRIGGGDRGGGVPASPL